MNDFKLTRLPLALVLVAFVFLFAAVGQIEARRGQQQEDGDESISYRSRRQTASADRQQMGSAMAMASASMSGSPARPMATNSKPANTMVASSDTQAQSETDEEQPIRLPAKKQAKVNKARPGQKNRPTMQDDDEDYRVRHDDRRRGDDDDCDDDRDDGYEGDMFETMAMNPMRHFRRMMNSVLDQMPNNFGYGYGGDGGDSVASSASSAFSSGDGGYSKLSSSVTNNGRTRGIISETRNGRTKTRRIGDDDADEE